MEALRAESGHPTHASAYATRVREEVLDQPYPSRDRSCAYQQCEGRVAARSPVGRLYCVAHGEFLERLSGRRCAWLPLCRFCDRRADVLAVETLLRGRRPVIHPLCDSHAARELDRIRRFGSGAVLLVQLP
jgi:hypothetical protein